jgi:cell division protein FtsI/penicillin-binding protein 2
MNYPVIRRNLILCTATALLGCHAVAAQRGQIFDRNGIPLSVAIPGGTAGSHTPLSPSLAALVGSVDSAGTGIGGLEKTYDMTLRAGNHLRLTLDANLQKIVEDELHSLTRTYQPKGAYAIMAEPRTGAILAMAYHAAPDAAKAKTSTAAGSSNPILSAGFEPGSVIKALAVAGALDAGAVTLNTTFDCENGEWSYAGRPLRDSSHNYGVLPVRNIIQTSSNIGTAKIGILMGKERLDQTFRAFGIGQPTGIDLDNESSGIYRKLKDWDGLSVSRFAIGQGLIVTPLQMVQAYCALANNGVMPQLHLAARLENSKTGTVTPLAFTPKGRVIKPETAARITEALKLVTQAGGTAPKAAIAGYAVAGMTSTAQKVEHGADVDQCVASFIGYVPADAPAFVLLVIVDAPSQGDDSGGLVAAPAFSRIASQALPALKPAR